MSWYCKSNGKEIGPLSETELRYRISSGNIEPTDMVKAPGMTDWIAASEAASHFNYAPASATTDNAGSSNKSKVYLSKLRSSSCYSTFRGFISFFAGVGYLIAAIVALASFFTGSPVTIAIGIATAIAVGLLVRVSAEASLMLADIADSTIDSAAKRASAP